MGGTRIASRQADEVGTYSVAEFCKLLGIGTSTGYDLIRQGKMPVKPRMIGGSKKFLKSEVHRYLDGQ